ncbi:MAG: GNAT family N-acetyltransferase [Phycisphaerales bacterium]
MMPPSLTGRFVHIEPLHESHAADLAAGADAEMFRYFPPPYAPAGVTEADLVAYIRARTAGATAFAIIDRESGRAVGSSCYLDVRQEHLGLEIGATFILPAWRGTRVNPESKLLMLAHAFDAMGMIRVQLKCDARNTPSMRAIEKLGAVREGVLRRHMIVGDGFVRDTVMYSITREEWPGVRERLAERIGG